MSKNKGRQGDEVGRVLVLFLKIDRGDIIGGNTVRTFPSYIGSWRHRFSILLQWSKEAPPNVEFIVTEPSVAMIGDGS